MTRREGKWRACAPVSSPPGCASSCARIRATSAALVPVVDRLDALHSGFRSRSTVSSINSLRRADAASVSGVAASSGATAVEAARARTPPRSTRHDAGRAKHRADMAPTGRTHSAPTR